jgi:hypothetical protein
MKRGTGLLCCVSWKKRDVIEFFGLVEGARLKSTGEPMPEADKPCQLMAENDPSSL